MEEWHDLERFVTAQNRDGVYDQAVAELRKGHKVTGWMWFIFPQLRDFGFTETARFYGIASGDEASAYLAHDVLGPRLHSCAQIVARSGATSAADLLGGDVNARKLKSSMTLFAAVAEDGEDFRAVLREFYHGGRDLKTLDKLKAERRESEVVPNDALDRGSWWSRWLRGRG